ncbi:hypothetical protein T484DRAFT_1852226 [Baffinella frigidus]|nr:hypothetical protein T484DRAFT_1852226 [Cryptophyta sp. CCMP2293]
MAPNANVDTENETHLAALPGTAVLFQAKDEVKRAGDSSSSGRAALLNQLEKKVPEKLELKVAPNSSSSFNGSKALLKQLDKKVPEKLKLKVGAQVMILRN